MQTSRKTKGSNTGRGMKINEQWCDCSSLLKVKILLWYCPDAHLVVLPQLLQALKFD